MNICPRSKRWVLRKGSDDIVVGPTRIAIRLVRIVVVLGETHVRAEQPELWDLAVHTLVSTFQSHVSVVCGTAAMSRGLL